MAPLKSPPNIIYVFTDQQRPDTCGCYGQKMNITPNLDQMAKEGVLFENAFCVQPVCGPSRATIFTGTYATESGCYRNGIALPLNAKTIAHSLSRAGYEVGYIGKWHLASTQGPSYEKLEKNTNYTRKPVPIERRGGFNDYWLASDVLEFTSHGYNGHMFDGDGNKVEFEGYRVDCETDFVLNYLETRTQEKPFFLFISYLEPHHQNDHHRVEGPKGSHEKYQNYMVPEDLKGEKGDWKQEFPDYLGCCHSIDSNLGRIRSKLKELDLFNNTLVIFSSDHGCHFKTRNMEYKRSCHDASIHIPLVIAGPGFSGGLRIQNLVSLLDIAPTILKSADILLSKHLRGIPLQDSLPNSILDQDSPEWRRDIFIQISESQIGRAIRTLKWKYSVKVPGRIGWLSAKSKMYEEEFLYDLENDPYEKNNLIKEDKQIHFS